LPTKSCQLAGTKFMGAPRWPRKCAVSDSL
jgi:hypothetical protein